MENASKALLMASGILIAIIIISLLVNMFGSMGEFQKQKISEEEIARIEQFNKQFTRYQDQYVYGTEVITIINMIHNELQKNYTITAKITFAGSGNGYTYKRKVIRFGKEELQEIKIKPGESLSITNEAEGDDKGKVLGVTASAETIEGLKNRAFKCTEIKYDKDTGRVNYIKFEEKQYSDIS